VASPIICLVSGDRGCGRSLLDLVEAAAHAGVDLIQIRERRFSDRALLDLTRRAIGCARGRVSRIVVNDRADIALAAGAAGVHLPGRAFGAGRLRALAPEGFLIGRSVHTRDDAIAAAADGCDYLLFGTVFPSPGKPANHPVAGLDALREVCEAVQVPVLAIGGMSLDNVADVARTGASGIAAIGLFEGRAGIAAIVAELRRRFDT
jgi:thiamine-phosphate diphosphorylase